MKIQTNIEYCGHLLIQGSQSYREQQSTSVSCRIDKLSSHHGNTFLQFLNIDLVLQ